MKTIDEALNKIANIIFLAIFIAAGLFLYYKLFGWIINYLEFIKQFI